MALNVVSSDRLSTNVKVSNLATGLSGKVGSSKNLIINGAMQVAQRGTTSTSEGYQTVDQWYNAVNGEDEAATQAQVTLTSSDTGPWAKGFRNAYQITNGNQTGGADAGDYSVFVQPIEAQNLANSGWDYTSASSYISLSFWVKSSVAQNFYGRLQTIDGTAQNYTFETGALSANTWTKITKKIPGHANITIDNNKSKGLELTFVQFYGTARTGTLTLDAWGAYASATRTPNMTSTWWTTNDATFAVTGVQLEVGETSTEFEHTLYTDELAKCQRYCWVSTYISQAFIANGTSWNADSVGGVIHLPVPMRADPSVTFSSGNDFESTMVFTNTDTLSGGMSRPYSSAPPFSEFGWRGINTGAFTTGQGVILRYKDGQTGGKITAEATL